MADTVAHFRPRSASQAAGAAAVEDATLEFAAESTEPAHDGTPVPLPKRIALVVIVAVLLAAASGAVWTVKGADSIVSSGSLRVESDPPGAEVRIDGTARGTTPLSLTLPVGSHTLTVQQGTSVKQVPIQIASGTGQAFHLTWTETEPATVPATTGSLHIAADTAGSVVSVDGAERGLAPLTVPDLAVGPHEVVVRSADTTYRRSVQVEAGATASLVISGTTPAPAWGWITLDAPFPVQVLAEGRVIGTSDVDRIMLPPGDHQIEIVSEPFGFRQAQTVRIVAGRGGSASLAIPQVSLNINASPWADVFIDGVRVGDTPLAHVMLPIGDHDIVFRHPQLGEKRQIARVTLESSPRIAVDMRAR